MSPAPPPLPSALPNLSTAPAAPRQAASAQIPDTRVIYRTNNCKGLVFFPFFFHSGGPSEAAVSGGGGWVGRRGGGPSFPGRRSLPVSRENSIVLSAPVGLQPRRRRRYQPAQFTPEGAGLRGSVCVGEGGLSYSSCSRGQNGHGGSGCGTTCFPLAPAAFRHQGAVFFGGGHEAAKRVATTLSQVFPTFPSVTALDMRAIFPPEVHHDVGKREMKSFPDTTTFVVQVNKGAVNCACFILCRFDVGLTVFAQSVGSTEIPSLSQTPITDITERFSLQEPKARFQEKISFPVKRDCV